MNNVNKTNQNRLFSQVLQGKTSMQSIVDDWIETYKKDKEAAMCELIKFVVRCTGCKAKSVNAKRSFIDKELLRTKEFTQFINDLAESYNSDDVNDAADGADQNDGGNVETTAANTNIEIYPLVQTSLQARRFKSNFAEFLQLLVNQCQYSIVYDGFMMDVFISFLIGN